MSKHTGSKQYHIFTISVPSSRWSNTNSFPQTEIVNRCANVRRHPFPHPKNHHGVGRIPTWRISDGLFYEDYSCSRLRFRFPVPTLISDEYHLDMRFVEPARHEQDVL